MNTSLWYAAGVYRNICAYDGKYRWYDTFVTCIYKQKCLFLMVDYCHLPWSRPRFCSTNKTRWSDFDWTLSISFELLDDWFGNNFNSGTWMFSHQSPSSWFNDNLISDVSSKRYTCMSFSKIQNNRIDYFYSNHSTNFFI